MPVKSACFSAYSVDELLEKIKAVTDFKPTLGLIFSSVSLGIERIPSALIPGVFPVFGSSTCGEILPVSGEQPILEQSAVCCLLDLNREFFSVSLFERENRSGKELGNHIGAWGCRIFKKPGFIIAISGLKNNGEEITQGIRTACSPRTPVFGGMAGDDGLFQDTYVFSETGYTTDGAVVIVFDLSKISLAGIATSGWEGIGVEMVVTSSEGNVVHSINGRPAIDLYTEYLNISGDDLMKIGVLYPLLIKKTDGSSVLRAIMAADIDSGSLIFAGSIPVGSHVQFSSSFGYDIIEKSNQDVKEFYFKHPEVDLILFFSCMARLKVAGQMITDEINHVLELWKAPSLGFFTYGEIGEDKSECYGFYNETLTLALIRVI